MDERILAALLNLRIALGELSLTLDKLDTAIRNLLLIESEKSKEEPKQQ